MDVYTKADTTVYRGALTSAGRPLVKVARAGFEQPLLYYLDLTHYSWGDNSEATRVLAWALLLHAAGADAADRFAKALADDILSRFPHGQPWSLSYTSIFQWLCLNDYWIPFDPLTADATPPPPPEGVAMAQFRTYLAHRNGTADLKVFFQDGNDEKRHLCDYRPSDRPGASSLALRFAALVLLRNATEALPIEVSRAISHKHIEGFTREIIARLPPSGWTLTKTAILEWLIAHGETSLIADSAPLSGASSAAK